MTVLSKQKWSIDKQNFKIGDVVAIETEKPEPVAPTDDRILSV